MKTKKAAKEAGYFTLDELQKGAWSRSEDTCRAPMAPLHGAEPTIVKGEDRWHVGQCEPLISRSAAREQGLKLRDDATAPTTRRCFKPGRRVEFGIYRLSEFVAVRKRQERPAVEIDLLHAIFTVNRAAKRCRDSASAQYRHDQHGFARHASENKHRLYELKDHGIRYALTKGLITFQGQQGSFAFYQGGGYSFHSLLFPDNVEFDNGADADIVIASKVKEKSEGRLKDAVYTLEQLPDVENSKLAYAEREIMEATV